MTTVARLLTPVIATPGYHRGVANFIVLLFFVRWGDGHWPRIAHLAQLACGPHLRNSA